MNNPKCPYCGGEMKPNIGTGHNIHGNKTVWFTYCCDVCESESPPCDSRAEARAAAMKRDRAKGEWIDKFNKGKAHMQSFCSACGKHSGIGGISNNRHKPFCPNCGADMRKEADDERL